MARGRLVSATSGASLHAAAIKIDLTSRDFSLNPTNRSRASARASARFFRVRARDQTYEKTQNAANSIYKKDKRPAQNASDLNRADTRAV